MKKILSLILALVLTVSCLGGAVFAAEAEVSYTVDGVTKDGSMADAVTAVKAAGSGTIKLLKDYAFSGTDDIYAIDGMSSFTLDLNGFAFTSNVRGIRVTKTGNDTVTHIIDSVGTGCMNTAGVAVAVAKGGLHMNGVSVLNSSDKTVMYTETDGSHNANNLIENCTIVSTYWSALAFNASTTQANVSITLKNSTLACTRESGGTSAIWLHSSAVGSTVVLGAGVKLLSYVSTAVSSGVTVEGETLTKNLNTVPLQIAEQTIEGLSMWSTPDAANLADEIPATPEDSAAQAGWYANGTLGEGTIDQAVSAVKTAMGGAIKLYQNVDYTGISGYAISGMPSFTLDLNGCILTSAGGGIQVAKIGRTSSVTHITDSVGTGYIKTTGEKGIGISVSKGAIHLENLELWSQEKSVIYTETSPLYNLDNRIENCTVANPVWGAFSFNNGEASQENVHITIKNSTLASVKESGSTVLVMQPEAKAPGVIFDTGVKLLTYGNTTVDSNIRYTGKALTKTGSDTLEIAGQTFEGLNAWVTDPENPAELIPAEPADSTAEAGWYANGTLGEGTLADAVAAVKNAKGGVIKLYADVKHTDTTTYALPSMYPFTLDLNGNSIYADGCVQVDRGSGVTVITDSAGGGEIVSTLESSGKFAIRINKGGLRLKNVTVRSMYTQTVSYNETSAAYSADNLIENCTIVNPNWAAFAFEQTAVEGITFTVKNSILAATKASGSTVIERSLGTLNLGSGVKLMTYRSSSALATGITTTGETLTKSDHKVPLTVAGVTYEGLSVWMTPNGKDADAICNLPLNRTAAAGWLVDGTLYEGTLNQAVAAVSPKGGAIKLYEDVTHTGTSSYAISSKSALTLDLNGHTITSAGKGIEIQNTATGVTMIKNGNLDCAAISIMIRAGGLHLDGVTAWNGVNQNVSYLETSAAYNADNLIQNCTLANNAYGAFSFHGSTSQDDIILTVKNSTLANVKAGAGNHAISMSTAAVNPTVVFGENVKLMAYSTGYCLLHPNINERGTHLNRMGNKSDLTILGRKFTGLSVQRSTNITLPTVDIADTVANRQAAMVETAKAFWYKTPYVKYDSLGFAAASDPETGDFHYNSEGNILSLGRDYGARTGANWSSTPEMATEQRNIYQVCSFYVYQCTYLALGYKIMDGWNKYMIRPLSKGLAENNESKVFQFDNFQMDYTEDANGIVGSVKSDTEIQAAKEEAKLVLQPGDIVDYYRNQEDSRTHALMWIGEDLTGEGDADILNVDGTGYKYDEYLAGKYTTPDVVDSGTEYDGAVDTNNGRTTNQYHTSGMEFIFGDGSGQNLSNPDRVESYAIHRYANVGSLTESAKTRLKFKGLEIHYTVEGGIYGAVSKDGTVTYTLKIKNNSSDNHTGILVQIPVPENTTLTGTPSGATVANNVIKWTVSVNAGATATYSYTVNPTGSVGDVITASGFVHTIPLPELYTAITSSTPTAATVKSAVSANSGKSGAAFANAICKAQGVAVTIPEIDGIQDALLIPRLRDTDGDGIADDGYSLLQLRSGEDLTVEGKMLSKLMVPDFFGGFGVTTSMDSLRVKQLLAKDLQAGDLLLWQVKKGGATQVAVHNGTDLVKPDGTAVTQVELDCLFRNRFFIALRPTQLAEENSDFTMSILDSAGTSALDTLPKKDFSLRVGLENTPAASGSLAIAAYDANGKMVSLTTSAITMTEGAYTAPYFSIPNDGSVTKVKVILLSTLEELNPLITSKSLS